MRRHIGSPITTFTALGLSGMSKWPKENAPGSSPIIWRQRYDLHSSISCPSIHIKTSGEKFCFWRLRQCLSRCSASVFFCNVNAEGCVISPPSNLFANWHVCILWSAVHRCKAYFNTNSTAHYKTNVWPFLMRLVAYFVNIQIAVADKTPKHV